ncbi:unnamed protein product, partial [Scytosiphon promiscuus]
MARARKLNHPSDNFFQFEPTGKYERVFIRAKTIRGRYTEPTAPAAMLRSLSEPRNHVRKGDLLSVSSAFSSCLIYVRMLVSHLPVRLCVFYFSSGNGNATVEV